MYVDTHCHLNEIDLEAEIGRIRAAGLKRMLTVGYDLESSRRAVELAERYEDVYAAVGLQPTELEGCEERDLVEIERLASSKKCVCIGEIGMDYHYPETDKEKQKKFFLLQAELAHALKLPVSIHSRDDAADMYETVRRNRQKFEYGAVMHCYSHSAELAKEFVKLGMYLAFGGTVTYKNAKKTVESAQIVPIDRILTETDTPYLTPVPHRGERNSPAYIPLVAAKLAAVRGEEEQALTAQVYENARTLFQW